MASNLLKEAFVQDAIVRHLRRRGWSKDLTAASGKVHGVDVRVRHSRYGRWFLVEVKGDPGPQVKFPGSSREASFNSALGQVLTRMITKKGNPRYKWGNKFGIGFPASFEALVMRRLPWAVADKLNLFVFLVDPRGKVRQFDWRALKDRQTEAAVKVDRSRRKP